MATRHCNGTANMTRVHSLCIVGWNVVFKVPLVSEWFGFSFGPSDAGSQSDQWRHIFYSSDYGSKV